MLILAKLFFAAMCCISVGVRAFQGYPLRKDKYSSYFMASNSDSYRLKGFEDFVRTNPMTDKFGVRHFHHVEIYCGDATNTCKRFCHGLGMNVIGKSDLSTGNTEHASYCASSGDVKMLFTAPAAALGDNGVPENIRAMINYDEDKDGTRASSPFPHFQTLDRQNFFQKHGTGVGAVALEVNDVKEAYEVLMANGASFVLEPSVVDDKYGQGSVIIAEVKLYGDVVLRLINVDNFDGAFLPNFEDVASSGGAYGISRFDHIVGNVWELSSVQTQLMEMTGFHTFAEFVAEDVGTVDSGLNSVVLASNNEKVLLPLNEPTFGTSKKSQIQTYLEQNNGAGVQHMALFTTDIFETMRKMRTASNSGGFEFMPAQPPAYYKNLPSRIGEDALTSEQMRQVEELGLLVDKDDQGILIQIFTKPVGDRPTLFLEIIQRVGCDTPGCGGFGKGNFKDLFKSIEDFEESLGI